MVKTIGPQAAFYADRNNFAPSYCLPLCRVLYTSLVFFALESSLCAKLLTKKSYTEVTRLRHSIQGRV